MNIIDLMPCYRCGCAFGPSELFAVVNAGVPAAFPVHANLETCLSSEDRVIAYGQVKADGRRAFWLPSTSMRVTLNATA